MNKILIIAAHPDDELLGAGATVCRWIEEGAIAKSLILSTGLLSREQPQGSDDCPLESLRSDAQAANKSLGIGEIQFLGFPDNAMDRLPLLEVIKAVEKEIASFKPTIIMTHFSQDLNIDHRITFQAVMTSCRPQNGMDHPDIYSFFIPSSTDWFEPQAQPSFSPNVYVDVKTTIEKKIKALAHYTSEMKPYPHSRSLGSVINHAKYWGNRVGLQYAEPLILIRKVQ